MDAFDAVVVGSGFAGAWATKELTENGLRALVLEAGPMRDAGDVPARFALKDSNLEETADAGSEIPIVALPNLDGSYPGNSDLPRHMNERQYIQRRHPSFRRRGPNLFVDDCEYPYTTPVTRPYWWIRGMQVGGRSLTWGGTALRLSPNELGAKTLDGVSLKWPLDYDDLSPWYSLVEDFMGVCGSYERLVQAPDGVYSYEPQRLTPAEQEFQHKYRAAGTRPIPVRFIPESVGQHGWPGFTMQATALAAAERTGRMTLVPNSFVSEVCIDTSSGLARAVKYVDTCTSQWHEVHARMVFLCCGTIETARLMLNSKSSLQPRGLGNSSGWVGRGLMDHPIVSASGVIVNYAPLTNFEWSARQRGLMVPPRTHEGTEVRPFGLWVTLQRLSSQGNAIGTIDAQGEMLPAWSNRVRIGSSTDRWGIPIPLIDCEYGPHELRLYHAMRKEIEGVASCTGLTITEVSDSLSVPGLNVHDLGTARMGRSPRNSVVDSDNRCWDCRNVFVTDGACFPSGGWQNPTLTIMALSARAGRHAAHLLNEGRI